MLIANRQKNQRYPLSKVLVVIVFIIMDIVSQNSKTNMDKMDMIIIYMVVDGLWCVLLNYINQII